MLLFRHERMEPKPTNNTTREIRERETPGYDSVQLDTATTSIIHMGAIVLLVSCFYSYLFLITSGKIK